MRLGIVGMLPGDFRTFTKTELAAMRALTFTGFGFHLNGEAIFDITTADCRHYHQLLAGEGLDLAHCPPDITYMA